MSETEIRFIRCEKCGDMTNGDESVCQRCGELREIKTAPCPDCPGSWGYIAVVNGSTPIACPTCKGEGKIFL